MSINNAFRGDHRIKNSRMALLCMAFILALSAFSCSKEQLAEASSEAVQTYLGDLENSIKNIKIYIENSEARTTILIRRIEELEKRVEELESKR